MSRYRKGPPRGEHHHRARLTVESVKALRHMVEKQGVSMAEARRAVCPEISYQAVVSVINYANWRWVL